VSSSALWKQKSGRLGPEVNNSIRRKWNISSMKGGGGGECRHLISNNYQMQAFGECKCRRIPGWNQVRNGSIWKEDVIWKIIIQMIAPVPGISTNICKIMPDERIYLLLHSTSQNQVNKNGPTWKEDVKWKIIIQTAATVLGILAISAKSWATDVSVTTFYKPESDRKWG
jgi:hypothetical protein